jgi:hypothetical protein
MLLNFSLQMGTVVSDMANLLAKVIADSSNSILKSCITKLMILNFFCLSKWEEKRFTAAYAIKILPSQITSLDSPIMVLE